MGVNNFFFYIYDLEKIVKIEFATVTWFYAPWIGETISFYYGQKWCIHHCLYYNRMYGNQWTFYLGADEFLVKGGSKGDHKKVRRLSDVTNAYSGNDAITFGTYRIEGRGNNIKFPGKELIFRYEKGDYPFCDLGSGKVKEDTFLCTRVAGRRKSILKPSVIDNFEIHSIDKQKQYTVLDLNAKKYSLLHIKGSLEYRNSPY